MSKTPALISALLFGALLLSSIANGGTMESILKGANREELISALAGLKGSTEDQLYYDVSRAVRCLERHAEDQKAIGLTEVECSRYFVSLISGRSLREIICSAASIMLAESADVPLENTLNGLEPQSEAFARRRHLVNQRSTGLYFLRTYGLSESSKR